MREGLATITAPDAASAGFASVALCLLKRFPDDRSLFLHFAVMGSERGIEQELKMATTTQFNPDRLAYFEASGWRAYYDRKWLKMVRLIVALCQEQFGIPFPISLLAAYYSVRASVAWVPVNHNEQKVLAFLEKFYRVARRYSSLKFDPVEVANLELRYFAVHRRLVGTEDRSEFVQVLTDLHSAIFDLKPEQVRESAEWRVRAADTVDRITGKTSADVEGDWAKLEEYLRRCYRSIQHEKNS